MPEAVTIVHLSDLQYGRFHRFPENADPANRFDSLAERLIDDLRYLREEHRVDPDLLIVTGDLAEWAKKKEFERVHSFLRRILDALSLPASRMAVIPGNHDINRDACEAYFKDCSAEDIDPVPPFLAKWKFFRGFFTSLYEGCPFAFTEERPYTLFAFPEIRTVVAGLNSTMAESHRPDDHYGFAGEPQYRWFADELRTYADQGWLRIAAVHHNVRRGNTSDDENLRDADMLNAYLGPLVHFVLHGHTHNGKADVLRNNVPIYATGSAAVKPDQRPPEVPNQYQVLRVTPHGIERIARAYVPDPAKPHFTGDTRADDRGEKWIVADAIRFDRVHGAFPDQSAPPPPVEHIPPHLRALHLPQDDLLSRVERVAQLRHGSAVDIQTFRLAGDPLPYLRVSLQHGDFVTIFPVGAVAGLPTADVVRAFASSIHARYKTYDYGVPSLIVYGSTDAVSAEARAEAKRLGVNLQSWLEYQGLINFAPLVSAQTTRLLQDPRYPASLYIPQRYRTTISGEDRVGDDALDLMVDAMTGSDSQFIVVLGEFGTGKSFLQRRLAVRLAEIGHPNPIFIEMRTLEKGRTLEELVAQHLVRNDVQNLNLKAFRYMLEQGRIALLFDGFDELVMRVTYERAAEHLETLLQAAVGNAKVVVTSRTQFFESDQQVRTALGERLDIVGGRRIVRLLRFERPQIQAFLTRWTGSEEEAQRRMELLDDVKDLMGLSENPRMLSFIAELERVDLEKARGSDGKVTSAALYRVLIERWLQFEIDRIEPRGAAPGLPLATRWDAVSVLARHLWERPDPTIRLSEVGEKIAETIVSLPHFEPASATHQVASGTLLVRDADGNFSFVHQSVLEWLVANNAANELRAGAIARALTVKEMSRLMVDFFIDLGGAAAVVWAREIASAPSPDPVAKKNAVNILNRLPKEERKREATTMRLAGTNLRAQDFSGQVLGDADFAESDLVEARFIDATLHGASFRGANLTDADLSGADLRDADLAGANLTRARLIGAKLGGAKLTGANLTRAKLIGAEIDAEQLATANTFGAAVRIDETFQSVLDTTGGRLMLWDRTGEYLYRTSSSGIRVYDVVRGRLLREFPVGDVMALSVSDDNRRLAVGTSGGRVAIIEVATGRSEWFGDFQTDRIRALRFTRDSRRLVVATSKAVRDIDTESMKVSTAFATDSAAWDLAVVAPDGDSAWLANRLQSSVELWQRSRGNKSSEVSRTGRYISAFSATLTPPTAAMHDAVGRAIHVVTEEGGRDVAVGPGLITSMTIDERGSMLAYAQGDSVVFVDLATSESSRMSLRAFAIQFDPSGRFIAAGGSDGLSIVDVAHLSIVRVITEDAERILDIVARSRSRVAVLTSADFRAWISDEPRLESSFLTFPRLVRSGAIDEATSRVVVVDEEGTANVFSREGVRLYTYEFRFGRGVVALQGDFLAAVEEGRTVLVVDIQKGRQLDSMDVHGRVSALAFQPGSDMLWIFSGFADNATLQRAHVRTGKIDVQTDLDISTTALTVTRDGTVVTSYYDGVHVLQVRGQRVEERLSERDTSDAFLSADGQWLITWNSTQLRIRKGIASAPRFVIPVDSQIRRVSISPDERTLFCAAGPGVVLVFDLKTGSRVATLAKFKDGLVAYRPNGQYRIIGDIAGRFGHSIGLCRFDPGELMPYAALEIPEKEPLIAFD